MATKRVWDDFTTELDRKSFEASGFGQRGGLGKRPALLMVDFHYSYVGDRPEPILESIKRFRNSCGERGWRCVEKAAELLAAARQAKIPIFHSTNKRRADGMDTGRWSKKNNRAMEIPRFSGHLASDFIEELAPLPEEVVIHKIKPSIFFGTPLVSLLNDMKVDSVLIAGATTSGCVRATVLDAFSYNYAVGVVEECVVDRWESSHAMTLFDLNAKYADVVSLAEAKEFLRDFSRDNRKGTEGNLSKQAAITKTSAASG